MKPASSQKAPNSLIISENSTFFKKSENQRHIDADPKSDVPEASPNPAHTEIYNFFKLRISKNTRQRSCAKPASSQKAPNSLIISENSTFLKKSENQRHIELAAEKWRPGGGPNPAHTTIYELFVFTFDRERQRTESSGVLWSQRVRKKHRIP